MNIKLWMVSICVSILVSFAPIGNIQSSEVSHTDFGGCVIESALVSVDSELTGVFGRCSQQYDEAQALRVNPWANVAQCYDAYQIQAQTQRKALTVFQGCSWYFKDQQA